MTLLQDQIAEAVNALPREDEEGRALVAWQTQASHCQNNAPRAKTLHGNVLVMPLQDLPREYLARTLAGAGFHLPDGGTHRMALWSFGLLAHTPPDYPPVGTLVVYQPKLAHYATMLDGEPYFVAHHTSLVAEVLDGSFELRALGPYIHCRRDQASYRKLALGHAERALEGIVLVGEDSRDVRDSKLKLDYQKVLSMGSLAAQRLPEVTVGDYLALETKGVGFEIRRAGGVQENFVHMNQAPFFFSAAYVETLHR